MQSVGMMIHGRTSTYSCTISRLRAIPVALAVLSILAPSWAGTQPVRREFTELHMGVAVRIVLHGSDDAAVRTAARAAFARIAELEDVMSDYRPGSEVRRLAAAPVGEPVALGTELCAVLGAALEMARASGGAYDPAIGPFVALWREARRTGTLPSPDALAEARTRVGWRHLRLDTATCTAIVDVPGMKFDLGGIAKGFILDEALAVLAAHGSASALIEAGGDIVAGAPPPGSPGWKVAVPHADSALAARSTAFSHGAISTSGSSEQFVEIDGRRYSHIIDPHTGLGSTTGVLATVIARTGATADALATALSVAGPAQSTALLREHPGVVALCTGSPDASGARDNRAAAQAGSDRPLMPHAAPRTLSCHK